jgi:hypothetical protein
MPAKKKKAAGAPQSAAAAAAADPQEPQRRPQPQEFDLKGEGVERPCIPALDEAGRDYITFRDARMEAGRKEKENKTLVLALMDKHKLGSYKVDDFVLIVKPKDATARIEVKAASDYSGDQPTGDAGSDPADPENDDPDK